MPRKKKETKETVELVNTKKENILLEEKVDIESIRKELKDYVDEIVDKKFTDEIDKANKKLLREKSKKIFWKNIIIIVLLLIIGFLLFLLYKNDYFDNFFNHENRIEEKEKQEIENKEEKKEENKEEKKEPTLEELKKEYSSLLDNYYVPDSSIYLDDFYTGKLTRDMMMYMTLNSFDFSTLAKEEDYNIIKESTFKTMFEKLFDEDYEAITFKYDDNKIRYLKPMESFLSESVLVRVDNNIIREIKDIKVDGKRVLITTVEGLVKDNKLYNILTDELVSEYKDESLLKYENKLNIVMYSFEDGKLINLTK